MIWYEVKQQFKRINIKAKIGLILLFIFQTGYFFVAFIQTDKNLLMLGQPLYFSFWRLPLFLLLFTTLLEKFSQFQNIRLTKTTEFKVNLVLLGLSVFICIGLLFITLVGAILIFKVSTFGQSFIYILNFILRYIEVFTIIGLAEWLGYCLGIKKSLMAGLILAFFVGASFYQSEEFLHTVFVLIYYDLNNSLSTILLRLLVAIGVSLCLMSITNYLTMNKENLKE